jgi:hypothetical protein
MNIQGFIDSWSTNLQFYSIGIYGQNLANNSRKWTCDLRCKQNIYGIFRASGAYFQLVTDPMPNSQGTHQKNGRRL